MKIDGVTIQGSPMTDEQTAQIKAVMDEALALNQHPVHDTDIGDWLDSAQDILTDAHNDLADDPDVADPTDIRNRLVLLIAVACAAVASFDSGEGETK